MKLLKARELPTGYIFCAHLDETKLIPDPALPAPAAGEKDTRPLVPDPAWCFDATWGPFVSGQKAHGGANAPTVTKTMYLAQIRAEFKLLCEHELAQRVASTAPTAGRALAGEGEAL